MATKEKDDISAPIAVLLMFLAFALAAGSIGGGGGDGGRRDRAGAEDPCDGKEPDRVVRSWSVDRRTIYLRCGDHDQGWGYRHIRERRIDDNDSLDDVLDCIGRTLARAGIPKEETTSTGIHHIYRWTYANQHTAVARVQARTGNIRTVAPNGTWAHCAGR